MAVKFSKNSTTMNSAMLVKPNGQTAPGTGVNGIPASIGMTQVFNSNTNQYDNVDAYLELQGTDGGMLFNRMTTAQMLKLNVVDGTKVYVTDFVAPATAPGFWSFVNGAWAQDGTGGGGAGVTNVTGTSNQIQVANGSTTPAISLAALVDMPGDLTVKTPGATLTVNQIVPVSPTGTMLIGDSGGLSTTNIIGALEINGNPISANGIISVVGKYPTNQVQVDTVNDIATISLAPNCAFMGSPTAEGGFVANSPLVPTAEYEAYRKKLSQSNNPVAFLAYSGDYVGNDGGIIVNNGTVQAGLGINTATGDIEAVAGKIIAGTDVIAGNDITTVNGTVTGKNITSLNSITAGNGLNVTAGNINAPTSNLSVATLSVNGGPNLTSAVQSITAGSNVTITGTATNPIISATGGGGGGVTSITAGTGLSGGSITSTGTIAINNTGVTAGTYSNSTFTVNAQGQITTASNGASPVTNVGGTTNQIISSGGATPAISLAPSVTISGAFSAANFNANTAVNTPIVNAPGTLTFKSNGTNTGTLDSTGNLNLAGSVNTVTGVFSSSLYTNNILPYNSSNPLAVGLSTTPLNLIGSLVTINGSPLGNGTVTNVSGTTDQINVTSGSTTPTISLAPTTVTAGSYTAANITVDSLGRITAASNGSAGGGTVTSVIAGNNLTGGTITDSGTISLSSTPSNLTSLGVGNLGLAGNTISGTGTNQNVVISPNGTGELQSSNSINIQSGKTLKLYNASNTFYSGFKSMAALDNTVWRLPISDSVGFFSSDGSGNVNIAPAVTSVGSGTGINVTGSLATAPIVGLANTTVTAGSYTNTTLTVDAQGRLTAASSGTAPVTSVTSGNASNITIGGTAIAPTIDLANTAVTAGSYTNTSLTVDAKGRLTAVSSGIAGSGTVTSVTAGTGLSGGAITTSGTISLANTAVTAGSYTNTTLTVNAQGQLTAASSGTPPVTSVTGVSGQTAITGTATAPIVGLATAGTAATTQAAAITTDTFGRITGTVAKGIIFLKSGSGTLSGLPAGITNAKVTLIGGGADGGNATTIQAGGGGGGAGCTIIAYIPVSNGMAYSVGAQGGGGTGNSTTIGSGTTLITALGGKAPTSQSTASLAAAGGLGGTGTIGSAIPSSSCIIIAGGGAMGGSSASGSSSGSGGNSSLGGGGAGVNVTTTNVTGVSGVTNTGGGGSGAGGTTSGGTGASGIIIIEW